MEMVQVQNRNIELEGLLDKFNNRDQTDAEELKDKSEIVARLEAKVAELKKKEVLAKKKAIKEFKSSDDFQKAVVTSASNYFGVGFDFYKRQLAHHNPNLGIDLDNMEMDCDLFKKEETEAKER